MSNETIKDVVTVEIADLEEVVGGALLPTTSKPSLTVTPISSGIVGAGLGAYDPDTCPVKPGTPLSTCMCPGSSIGTFGNISFV